MGMKQNQRIALTKELIHRAFIELLKKEDIHKISIRELCDNAGINRTTFYNHYGSQYDVLSEITDNYLSEISETIEDIIPKDKADVLHRVTLVFSYIEQNIEISRLLIQNNIDESFAHKLFSLPKIEVLLEEYIGISNNQSHTQEIATFAIYGSYKLLSDWISQDIRVSPDEMAKLILSLSQAVCNTSDVK